MSAGFDEPTIPSISPRARRLLLAGWISLGVHAALVALVQVAPPGTVGQGGPVIEARLVSTQSEPRAVKVPPLMTEVDVAENATREVPLLVSSVTAEAVPVAEAVVVPPVPAAPAAAPQPAPGAAAAAAAPEPAAALTSAVDLTYYSAREVDVQAKPMRDFDLKYPEIADRRRLSGKVRLNIWVEADGRVSDIEFVSATHPDLYDESKLKAILDMPFEPAQKNGRPVRELYQIEVEYDWEGRPRN
jgi:protein TonB